MLSQALGHLSYLSAPCSGTKRKPYNVGTSADWGPPFLPWLAAFARFVLGVLPTADDNLETKPTEPTTVKPDPKPNGDLSPGKGNPRTNTREARNRNPTNPNQPQKPRAAQGDGQPKPGAKSLKPRRLGAPPPYIPQKEFRVQGCLGSENPMLL